MKVIFLDRDGVINKYPGDFEYIKSWEEFQFLPKARESLKKLSDQGFKIFILSNQAGVSKGIYSKKTLDLITSNMLKELKCCGVKISGVYYCIHRQEDDCNCRKPKTGLIDMAVEKLRKEWRDIELSGSYFVGDSIIDMQAAQAAGLKALLVFSGKEKKANQKKWAAIADYTADDLHEAVKLILKDKK